MKTIFGLVGAAPFSFRRCLWLCLPALIVGAVLRISLLTAIPEAFYGSDSNSYFETARDVYLKGDLRMPPKRRYLYPVLLIAAPIVPFCTTPQIVALVQHAAGLAMLLGIGWIVGHLVRRPNLWVPLVTLCAAIWPRMLYYEHEMLGECLLLGVFIIAGALAAPPGALTDRRRLGWFLLAALGIMMVKPAGRPLWLGLFLAAMLLTRNPLAWPRLYFLFIPAAVLLAKNSGGDGQGPWLFLSSALPLVRAEGEPFARERALLRPAIEEARADLPNYAFNQQIFKKILIRGRPDSQLGPDYVALVKDKRHFSKVANALAKGAVLESPLQFGRLVWEKTLVAASNRVHDARLLPARFWSSQAESSEGRWQARPKEMALLYETDEAGYDKLVAERAQRTAWFNPYVRWVSKIHWVSAEPGAIGQRPSIGLTALGWLAVLGLVGALVPGRFARTSILWLPILLYIPLVFAVGDRVSRYYHPLEWAMFALIAIGLDTLLDALAALWKRGRPAIATNTAAVG